MPGSIDGPFSQDVGGEINVISVTTGGSSTSTFVLKSDSELVLDNGATIWMSTGFAALEIPEAESGLTAGKLVSSNGGFIFGNVINHGIIDFAGALNILFISGDYVQGEEGVLGMRLKNITGLDQANDQLQVIGDAELDGGLFLSAIESLLGAQTWTLIATTGGITGEFADIEYPDANPNWTSFLDIPEEIYFVSN